VALRFTLVQIAQAVVDDTDFGGLFNHLLLALKCPLERREENILNP